MGLVLEKWYQNKICQITHSWTIFNCYHHTKKINREIFDRQERTFWNPFSIWMDFPPEIYMFKATNLLAIYFPLKRYSIVFSPSQLNLLIITNNFVRTIDARVVGRRFRLKWSSFKPISLIKPSVSISQGKFEFYEIFFFPF